MSRGFRRLERLDRALELLRSAVRCRPQIETIPIERAMGRWLARDVYAKMDVPPFDRAAFDGFAVRAEDTIGASRGNPVMLRLVGKALPGQPFEGVLKPGEAVEIASGVPMPAGANAVVPYEEASVSGDYIEIYRQVPPGYYVSVRGEDIRAGELIARAGTRLRPWHIAVMVSAGIREIEVYRVRAALISTGSELVELGEEPRPGKVINSSRYLIEGLLREWGVDVEYMGIVPDDEEAIRKAVAEALERSDMVVTTGGVSVGEKDLTVRAVASLGPDVLVHGVSIRPGRPNSFAVIGGKPVIMLSGYPVAAYVGLTTLGRTALLTMVGGREDPQPVVKARMARRVPNPPGVATVLRVVVRRCGDGYIAEPLAITGSGILSTLTRGNAIVVIGEDREGVDEGEEVEAILHAPVEEC